MQLALSCVRAVVVVGRVGRIVQLLDISIDSVQKIRIVEFIILEIFAFAEEAAPLLVAA